MITGKIHSFETFGTVDGPGIRFVVFMQGCPLRCIYCHNRDTWDASKGTAYTVEEVISEMSKYQNYMTFSKGGITLSGGEPLLQATFVEALFKRCRALSIHTALDTSGFSELPSCKTLLSYTNLVLLDIKHAVNEKHQHLCGVENDKPKAFARYCQEQGIPLWIRYVLVPGYTDAPEDLKSAGAWIRALKNVEKVEVLPYHSMGSYKWESLGVEYPLKGVREPSSEEIENAQKLLQMP